MQSQNSDISSFGEFPLSVDSNTIECFEPHEHGHTESCNAAEQLVAPLYSLAPFPLQRPSDAELKQIVVDYYDELCSNSETIALGATQYTSYMSMMDEYAMQVVSSCAKIKPLNILSIGAGSGTREEIVQTHFKSSICNLIVNDASMRMCIKAAVKGFDIMPGFFQDLNIKQQIIGFDLIMALDCTENLSSSDELGRFFRNISMSLTHNGLVMIDFFNMNELGGWGSQISQIYTDESLGARGFEMGEYFYRRKGIEQVGYARYFPRKEIFELIEENNLKAVAIEYFDQKTGTLIEEQNASSFIMLLQRP
jgi:hypothetical protein